MEEVIDQLYVTGEGQPKGKGPAQNLIQSKGNAYLDEKYPSLSYIKAAKILNDFEPSKELSDEKNEVKSLRGEMSEKLNKKGMEMPKDVHRLDDKIDVMDGDDGLDTSLRNGAYVAVVMIVFLCACMVPRGGGAVNRRDE